MYVELYVFQISQTPRDTEVTNAKESKAKSLIEELSCQPSPDKSKISSDGDKERVKSGLTELGQAMEEICDPLIPVRGHALITMCRLIKKRDPEAVKKQETLLKIFQENLAHLDSYLYLAAVNGLVAMVDIVPDTIIPCLVKEYRDRSSQTEEKSQRSKVNAETRMKVGECLVQTSRNLGIVNIFVLNILYHNEKLNMHVNGLYMLCFTVLPFFSIVKCWR